MATSQKSVEPTEDEIAAKRRAAYARAQKRLQEAHRAELDQYLTEEYAADGLTYNRRLTPVEKAAAQIKRLQDQFPELKDGTPF